VSTQVEREIPKAGIQLLLLMLKNQIKICERVVKSRNLRSLFAPYALESEKQYY